MMWLDCQTLYTHSFESRAAAAGVLQNLINGVTNKEDGEGLEAINAVKFGKRKRLEFSETGCLRTAVPFL